MSAPAPVSPPASSLELVRGLLLAFGSEARPEALLAQLLATCAAAIGADSGQILTLQRNGRELRSHLHHASKPEWDRRADVVIPLYRDENRLNLDDRYVYTMVTGEVVQLGPPRHAGPTVWLAPLSNASGTTLGVLQICAGDAGLARHPSLDQELEPTLRAFAALAGHVLTAARLQDENRQLTRQLDRLNADRQPAAENKTGPRDAALDHVVGDSAAFKTSLALAKRAASSHIPILLLGETGVGKDVFARAIHQMSARQDKPFIPQNCAAIPDTLLESELFGHVRGAFTGAHTDKKGLIQEAAGGTLFLDEIGDMPLTLQAKLLRFLEDGVVRRLGETRGKHVDVRLLAATNADLATKMAKGQFREDLFYRLNVFPISLPPLRDRGDDIPHLIEYFLASSARALRRQVPAFTPRALDALAGWHFPGNVRELRNIIERAMLLADDGQKIDLAHLPADIAQRSMSAKAMPVAPLATGQTLRQALHDFEAMLIAARLSEVGWNQSRASQLLKISRRNLVDKIKRYDLRRMG